MGPLFMQVHFTPHLICKSNIYTMQSDLAITISSLCLKDYKCQEDYLSSSIFRMRFRMVIIHDDLQGIMY